MLVRGICSVDGCSQHHKARGYCPIHYQQWKRGVPLIAEVRRRDRTPHEHCSEEGCASPVKAKGLCKAHYARLLRHGHTRYHDRKRTPKICSAVGCENHLYAKGVCHLHYMREHKLCRKFGITVARWNEMLAEQGGACAICGTTETRPNWRSGQPDAMHVDHDHATGAIRALLCNSCNRGLGIFGDSASRLRAAAAYLERHAAPTLACDAPRTPAADGTPRDYLALVPMPALWPPPLLN